MFPSIATPTHQLPSHTKRYRTGMKRKFNTHSYITSSVFSVNIFLSHSLLTKCMTPWWRLDGWVNGKGAGRRRFLIRFSSVLCTVVGSCNGRWVTKIYSMRWVGIRRKAVVHFWRLEELWTFVWYLADITANSYHRLPLYKITLFFIRPHNIPVVFHS